MNPSVTDHSALSQQADYELYRVLSTQAVAALIVTIVSLPALAFVRLSIVPLIGMILGFNAWRQINSRPTELAGRSLAIIATIGSSVIFVASIAIATTIYLTEVPPGYQRIHWSHLQPDPARPGLPVSPMSLELNGKSVFVKGYVYPDETGGDLKSFVLVPDMGTCCFGGQPKLTDMIQVTLNDPLRIRYSRRLRRLGGTLRVDKIKKPLSGLDGVYYQLDADYVK